MRIECWGKPAGNCTEHDHADWCRTEPSPAGWDRLRSLLMPQNGHSEKVYCRSRSSVWSDKNDLKEISGWLRGWTEMTHLTRLPPCGSASSSSLPTSVKSKMLNKFLFFLLIWGEKKKNSLIKIKSSKQGQGECPCLPWIKQSFHYHFQRNHQSQLMACDPFGQHNGLTHHWFQEKESRHGGTLWMGKMHVFPLFSGDRII